MTEHDDNLPHEGQLLSLTMDEHDSSAPQTSNVAILFVHSHWTIFWQYNSHALVQNIFLNCGPKNVYYATMDLFREKEGRGDIMSEAAHLPLYRKMAISYCANQILERKGLFSDTLRFTPPLPLLLSQECNSSSIPKKIGHSPLSQLRGMRSYSSTYIYFRLYAHAICPNTWWIISMIVFAWGFVGESGLAFKPYLFSIKILLNSWPMNYDTRSYAMLIGQGYLSNHVVPTKFSTVIDLLVLYWIYSNHPITGSNIATDFNIKGFPSFPAYFEGAYKICTYFIPQNFYR